MVVSKFSENFWGEKNNGFDILSQNLKHSLQNVKDLEFYFVECEKIENSYSKLLAKLATQINNGFSSNGTFQPTWSPIKELNERLASTHAQIMHQIRDIIKETQRYHDDLNKKIKRIRDNESQTQTCVQNFKEISELLNKTKEQYHSCALDLEKQKRAENPNVQKLEKKVKQSYEEYKSNVEKYNLIRNEFERKFFDASTHLQMSEELHLKQIKQLVDNYQKIFINNNHFIKQIYDEFQVKIESLSSDVLIQIFIDNKKTGSERPESVSIIEPDFSKLPSIIPQQQQQSFNPNSSNNSNNSAGVSGNNYNSLSNNNNNNDNDVFMNIPVSININNSPFNNNNGGGQIGGGAVNVNNSSSSSTSSSDNMKRSDSRGLNIFNIDILSRNKGKSKKASEKASITKNNKNKTKSDSNNQLLQKSQTPTPSIQHDLIQMNSTKDSNSINSDDLISTLNGVGGGGGGGGGGDSISMNNNIRQSSQSNRANSSSLDLFDQLNKLNSNGNGSDVDSEGYSIRPEKSDKVKKDTDDMNNFYNSSSTSDNDSDSEPEAGMGPTRVMLKIKPKNEVSDNSGGNSEVLVEVSKNLQLKSLSSLQSLNGGGLNQQSQKKGRTYYSFGTLSNAATIEQQNSSLPCWSSSPPTNNQMMSKSISFSGSTTNISPSPSTTTNNDLGFNTNDFSKAINITPTPPPLPPPPHPSQIKQSNEVNLYNIDEDKEVESSFQSLNIKRAALNSQLNNFSLPAPNSAPSIPGRFTPACLAGRSTPNFQHSSSFLEGNSNSRNNMISSPLTLVNGSYCVPLAVQFNEVVHAYFKLSDANRMRIKCNGCLKISFPHAILKFLTSGELPMLEFRLNNVNLTSQDLTINEQLLMQTISSEQQFQFNTLNLVKELKEQHQQNKQAAFFNFELLKYEVKSIAKPPLFLNATWSLNLINSNNVEISFSLDYSNQHAKPILNLNFMLVLAQQLNVFKITNIDSKPQAQMQTSEQKLQILWSQATLAGNTSESLSARFNVNILNKNDFKTLNALDTICTQPLFVKFQMDSDTLTHVKFDTLSPNYRLSLLREKMESGKYFSTPTLNLPNPQTSLLTVYDQILNSSDPDSDVDTDTDTGNNNTTNNNNKTPTAGTISTQIGSTVDILFNY